MRRRSLAIIVLAVSITFFWKQSLRGRKTMGVRDNDEERRLVEACRAGSPDAWNQLYCDYEPLVRAVVRVRLRKQCNEDAIEDTIQEVFLELMSALKRFDCSYKLSQFICGVARRTARGEVRYETADKRTGKMVPIGNPGGPDKAIEIKDPDPSPEDEVETAQLRGILRAGFKSLSEQCRKVIQYRDLDELPYVEVAEMLDKKENTLTKIRERCLEKLRAICRALLRKGCQL